VEQMASSDTEYNRLQELIHSKNDPKKIVFFGASLRLANLLARFKPVEDESIAYVCDNDKNKWHTKFAGKYDVYPPKQLIKDGGGVAVVISSAAVAEIQKQLSGMGIKNVFRLDALIQKPNFRRVNLRN
jgi:hypothetical protein